MSGLLVGLMRSDSAHDRADVLDVHWLAAADVHTVSRWKPMARYTGPAPSNARPTPSVTPGLSRQAPNTCSNREPLADSSHKPPQHRTPARIEVLASCRSQMRPSTTNT